MFKLRLLSTLLLLPLVIAGILFLPNVYVAIGSGVVFMVAAWEWLHMTVMKTSKIRFVLLLSLIVVAFSLLFVGFSQIWLYYLALLCWIGGFIGVCFYPRGTILWHDFFILPFVGLLMFVPSWLAFNSLHAQLPYGPEMVLLGCALIWGSDIGAYCCGKLWGKTKLAPHVSPGKTWAGFYGALGTGCLVMLGFYWWLEPSFTIIQALVLAVVTVIFAVIGDLVESMLKRIYGFKDSGNIIPGHGGAYDRIDSMLAAFPVYFLGLQILQNTSII